MIEWFLNDESGADFDRDDISACFINDSLSKLGLEEEAAQGYALFLPSRHDFSGFFVARLKRKSAAIQEEQDGAVSV